VVAERTKKRRQDVEKTADREKIKRRPTSSYSRGGVGSGTRAKRTSRQMVIRRTFQFLWTDNISKNLEEEKPLPDRNIEG